MVGNAYPYTMKNWASDIALASSKGLDGFVLNLGTDSWQPDRVADAFSAAQSAGSTFRIGFSFDMSVMPCAAASDAALLQSYITKYSSHPNVLQFDGKMLISTFSGETCQFGQGSVDAGWTVTVKTGMPPVHFIPSFFVDPSTLGNYQSIDGAFNWNGGWPQTQSNTSFATDQPFISALASKTYLGAVSPWFFTHYSPQTYNKNWIYDFDNWLFSSRWEVLIQNRQQVPIVEVITWNDYGESHYIGPIEGSQPNSQQWVDGFDHQGWLDIMEYYIAYYKTGAPPTIAKDRIFLWAKLYATDATAPDPVGPPKDANWAEDMLWAQFHLTETSDLTLTCGSSTQTFSSVPAGVSKQKLPLSSDCDMSAKITRSGSDAVSFAPAGMNFSTSPPSYNFNAFVAASPA
ncbi:glycoside hydrolase family 71 protein [Mycena maculata]|uniref:Glycoside hydrolase family 71 protein n=1 Tax=Mycena maculata TaxID=230809 RepID=A0AAD7J0P4_9AGAR|nr:glycoside hydrolase family 71 protein [Mycena maculata]